MIQRSHKKPDWFQDWSNDIVVIIASGPSATDYQYDQFKDQAKWIAVNTSYKLAPWADVVLAADGGWWLHHRGLPDYKGLKVTLDWTVSRQLEIPLLKLIKHVKDISIDIPGTVGMGGHSGFYAINLAIQFGAKKIILSGFDLRIDNGIHWHGPHPKGLNNPVEYRMRKLREHLDSQSKVFKNLKVEVVNVSISSSLKAYQKLSLPEALLAWRNANVD